MAKPTLKQKTTFRKMIEAIENGGRLDFKTLMMRGGYSEATAKNPTKNLLSKEGWKQLLAQIDDRVILAKLYEVMLGEDKRSSLTAADMLLKLKNKYPKGEVKAVALFKDLEE